MKPSIIIAAILSLPAKELCSAGLAIFFIGAAIMFPGFAGLLAYISGICVGLVLGEVFR